MLEITRTSTVVEKTAQFNMGIEFDFQFKLETRDDGEQYLYIIYHTCEEDGCHEDEKMVSTNCGLTWRKILQDPYEAYKEYRLANMKEGYEIAQREVENYENSISRVSESIDYHREWWISKQKAIEELEGYIKKVVGGLYPEWEYNKYTHIWKDKEGNQIYEDDAAYFFKGAIIRDEKRHYLNVTIKKD